MRAAVRRNAIHSNGNGGHRGEAAENFPGAGQWRKSSYSNAEGGDCVEVADDLPGLVPVRDSKHRHGPVLMFPATAWVPFVTHLKG
ncbi:DUF397 domain-containing protein [Streptomyces apocyni]|uniref:DUF397 domain-containing protein n=1 Tax=Streptomyces apocyni TaxID=2654677 RepID=UPI002D7E972B|nr:DUF397 domain-containing protein [Streptomyces apocyni]